MFVSRALRFQSIRTTFQNTRSRRSLPNLFSLPRRQALHDAAQQKLQYEAPRKRLTFRQKLEVYILLSATAQCIIFFVYEPIRDYGLFDSIAHWTVFRVVPFKKVRPQQKLDESSIYQPITKPNEIRLLVLEPGSPGDDLECRLINVRLSWRTKYEALSYTWGDASITRPLKCSGQTINATASLHDALTDLRLPRSRRYLWVDAICINQADNDEKGKQIMLMGQIYTQARRVLIHLGKPDPSVEGAMKDIRSLDWKFMPLHALRYCSRAAVFGPVGVFFMDLLPKMKPLGGKEKNFDWAPIMILLQRPWFQRTWIIQEAVLAKRADVVCGNQTVPWAALERVVVAMNMYDGMVESVPDYSEIEQAVEAVSLIRSARRDAYRHVLMPDHWLLHRYILGGSRQEFSKMLDLVQLARAFACTNPRDKIYGMLGITNEDTSGGEYLTPSYDSSPGEVFRRYVLWEILHNKSLRVLGVSSDKDPAATEFASPSWVPDFTRLDPAQRLTRFEKRANYIASLGHPNVEARVSEDGHTLYLKGKLIDTIHTVAAKPTSRIFDSVTSSDEDKQLLGNKKEVDNLARAWMKEAMGIWNAAVQRRIKDGGVARPLLTSDLWAPNNKNGGELTAYPEHWTYFLRALICDRTDWGNFATVGDLPYVAGVVRSWAVGVPLGRMFSKAEQPRVQGTIQAMIHAGRSRRFASTGMGLAGFVPMRAQEGDHVAVLYGSNVPCVLRPTGDGKYSLVGECYMHGLMWGAGALGLVGMKGQTREFAIV
ncbi:heterokaryon incompatibility protein-domain-containing protein [Podospora didyma]|uniref:Heterokaryon incompatibility protein-domain-containing protein n=1 Tax=Podospora didyma TaxID=330526 RepID=A0AAE0TZY3_9PEZI|nr:heterokaryon incompatibility protein-domain-containing protein [Podospora didyma]